MIGQIRGHQFAGGAPGASITATQPNTRCPFVICKRTGTNGPALALASTGKSVAFYARPLLASTLECAKSLARKSRFRRAINAIWVVQTVTKKFGAFHALQMRGCFAPSRLGERGACAIVTKRETGCGGRGQVERRTTKAADGEVVRS